MSESPSSSQRESTWRGRVAAVTITLFIVAVLILMFFAVRGPR